MKALPVPPPPRKRSRERRLALALFGSLLAACVSFLLLPDRSALRGVQVQVAKVATTPNLGTFLYLSVSNRESRAVRLHAVSIDIRVNDQWLALNRDYPASTRLPAGQTTNLVIPSVRLGTAYRGELKWFLEPSRLTQIRFLLRAKLASIFRRPSLPELSREYHTNTITECKMGSQ